MGYETTLDDLRSIRFVSELPSAHSHSKGVGNSNYLPKYGGDFVFCDDEALQMLNSSD
jgi:hypothetical protein